MGITTHKAHVNANLNLLSYFCFYVFLWLSPFDWKENTPWLAFISGAGGGRKTGSLFEADLDLVAGLLCVTHCSL